MNNQTKLIEALRKELNLPASLCSDKEILKGTKGTFLRARIELYLAIEDLKEQLKDECRTIRKIMLGKL